MGCGGEAWRSQEQLWAVEEFSGQRMKDQTLQSEKS